MLMLSTPLRADETPDESILAKYIKSCDLRKRELDTITDAYNACEDQRVADYKGKILIAGLASLAIGFLIGQTYEKNQGK